MILESKDFFDQLAELDPNTGTYRLLSRKQHPELATIAAGSYSIIDDTMFSLYRRDGVLYFRAGDREFKLTDEVMSNLTREDNYRVFQLLDQGGNVLVDLRYLLREPEISLTNDPTAFIEEEDFDFLLFVHNVLKQTDRRLRIYTQ